MTVFLPPTAGEADDRRTAYTLGEVLPVAIESTAAGVPDRLAALTPGFAELAQPIALLPGGPSWLRMPSGLALPAEVEPPRAEAPSPTPPPGDTPPEILALTQEVHGLRTQLDATTSRITTLEAQLVAARTSTRSDRRRIAELEKAEQQARSPRALASPGLFPEPRDQFRHEMYVSWAERTTAAEKEQYPWQEPSFGPEFMATLDEVHGLDRAKVAEVAADVVCRRADTMPARAVHQLRQGPKGEDAPVTRPGGETCWRASLQHKSPAARRLHYWRLKDGGIGLSSVRTHDDFRP